MNRMKLVFDAKLENEAFARASGIRVGRMRLLGTTLSTVLAAVGILVYAQGYGFMQLYNGPMQMGFTSVAAVLIGGATPRRAAGGQPFHPREQPLGGDAAHHFQRHHPLCPDPDGRWRA